MPEAAAGRCAPAYEEASAWMESTNAFGAKNDEVENCGLRFALLCLVKLLSTRGVDKMPWRSTLNL